MISTFHGIEMGKRSLITHTKMLNVTGHNLNNLNTEGYSRQVVHVEAFDPLYVPGLNREDLPGMIGQGVATQSVVRVRDVLIDNRLIFENKNFGYFEVRNKYLHQVELVYSEPMVYNDETLVRTMRSAFDEFMSAWEDVANQPDEKSARTVLVERANILTNTVNHHYTNLKDIRNNIDMEIKDRVGELNDLAKKIAKLNERILKSEAVGDNPNDLYDQRDLHIDRLSKIVDLQISREDPDELILFIGGKALVQGAKFEQLNLVADANNEGYSDIYWADGEKVVFRGGELAGLVELRDTDLYYEIKKVNSFAANVTDLVNEIHRTGFGSNGVSGQNFFVEHPFTTDVTGNFDRDRDGIDDSTYLFRISGGNELDLKDKIGIRGQMDINGEVINYYETDTLENVITRINQSDARVNAFLNPQNQLTLKADYQMDSESPDFVIQHVEDNGLFLTGYAGILNESGTAGAFDWQAIDQVNQLTLSSEWSIAPLKDPAVYMRVEDRILSDNSYIATASGIDTDGDGVKDLSNGIGDSNNALLIGSIKDKKVMVGMSLTFSQYFENVISDIGSRSSGAEKGFKATEIIVQNLENLRKSVSGVNIDEEFANLVKFQHGYNATARFVTEMDKMLNVLINQIGV
ncbi:MAG: flagellar hook-associated protein FlgK [Spirochaetes bacterium]|nr:flagellar hook-associated protein FlgK [Spirochaetota bacterium]